MSRQDASLHPYEKCIHEYTMRTTSACELWCWMSSFPRCIAFYDAVFTHEMFFLIAKTATHFWGTGRLNKFEMLLFDGSSDPFSIQSSYNPFVHSILMNYVAIVYLANWFLHSRVFKSLCSLIWWFDKYFIISVSSFVSRIPSAFNWGEVKFREYLSFFPLLKMSKWTIQHVMHHTVIQLFLKYGCYILASFIFIFSLSARKSFLYFFFVMKSLRNSSLVKAKKKTSLMESWLIN